MRNRRPGAPREAATRIGRAGATMLDQLEDLVDLVRLGSGILEPGEPEPQRLGDVLDEAIATLDDPDVAVAVQPEVAQLRVLADRRLLRRLLRSALRVAAASAPGGATLSVTGAAGSTVEVVVGARPVDQTAGPARVEAPAALVRGLAALLGGRGGVDAATVQLLLPPADQSTASP